MLDVIAFDADDTLWHTEPYYRETERHFTEMLSSYGVAPQDALAVMHHIEIENLAYFGYGIRGFILSLIEAAVEVTNGQVRGNDIGMLVALGRRMTNHEIRLLEGAADSLAQLSQAHRLMLVTKGDTLDQESKITRSGLVKYFQAVEVVSDKTPAAYSALLAKYDINPAHFLMVGNSLRSDIAPVLGLGGYAVYVPYPESWAHESAADLPDDRARYFEISNLKELAELVQKIEAQNL